MADIFHSLRNAPEIAERRTRRRTLLARPIYVDLGKINGGIVFNISEDGLALSAAMVLRGNDPLCMRIQLPDSYGWIEATGQITWKSKTRKTGGIKFVDLSEDARQQIRNWLAAENSQEEPPPEGEIHGKLEHHPAGDGTARTPMFSSPDPVDSGAVAEKRMPELVLSENSSVLIDQPAGVIAELFRQPTRVVPEKLTNADSSPRLGERRLHPRWKVRHLGYVEMGRDNGGILLNISEGGLAVTAAMTLASDNLPPIRIQFVESRDWIEVSGQIAWISASKREAGIRFVNLTEGARKNIASRISGAESPAEHLEQTLKLPGSPAIHAEILEIPNLEIPPTGGARSVNAVQGHWRASAPSRFTVSAMRNDTIPATATKSDSLPRKLSNRSELKPKSRPAFRPMTSGAGTGRLIRLAAVVILAGVTGVVIGRVIAPHVLRKEMNEIIARNAGVRSNPPELKERLPTNKTTSAPGLSSDNGGSQRHEFVPVPADGPPTGSETPLAPVRPQVRSIERPAARPTVNAAVRRTESPLPKNVFAKLPERAVVAVPNPAVENARSQAVENPPVRPAENTANAATSLSTSAASETVVAEVKAKESQPPLVKQPAVPVPPTWSVAISADPYPSIRIPPEISSQKASRGSSLQIGRTITRVEPVYPDEAKRQGIEGTVKLHVVVGRDGAMQSVEPVSGPALLAKAATSAVREWRYTQTLLGGQPVETEQDIVIKFRLVSPSISRN